MRKEAEKRYLLDLTLRPRGKERLEETARAGSIDSQLQQKAHRCVGEGLEKPCGTWTPLVGGLSHKPIETQGPAINFIIFCFCILVVMAIMMVVLVVVVLLLLLVMMLLVVVVLMLLGFLRSLSV